MIFRKTSLSLGIVTALGCTAASLTPSMASAGIIPDGDYQIQVQVTPVGNRSTAYGGTETFFKIGTQGRGWNSSFTFGQLPNSTSQGMTDNDFVLQLSPISLPPLPAPGGCYTNPDPTCVQRGSGLAGDGLAATLDITVSGDAITVSSMQVDTIFATAGGTFGQFLNDAASGFPGTDAMSGTVDNAGNMTLQLTGRMGAIDGTNPDLIDKRWNVDKGQTEWSAFSSGTTTDASAGDITGVKVVNVGPTLNPDGFDDFTVTLINAGGVGTDWETFNGVSYYEVWKANIVSVNVTGNLPPTTAMTVTQGGAPATTIVQSGGDVTVTANAVDPDADVLNYTWTLTAGAVVTGGGTSSDDFVTYSPAALAIGSIATVFVSVDDGNNPPVDDNLSRRIVAAPVTDVLGDGIDDTIDRNAADPNAIQISQTASEGDVVHDGTGTIALSKVSGCPVTGVDGLGVTEADVLGSAGIGCTVPLSTAPDTIPNVGGLFDFQIFGLTNNETVRIVIPQLAAVPSFGQYRTYTPANGWTDFQISGADIIQTAPGAPGVCPAPGDAAYVDGLVPGSFCVQLTMQEGGPNDADGKTNGKLVDPGGVGQGALPPVPPTGKGSQESSFGEGTDWGCTIASGNNTVAPWKRADPWLLTGLLGWLGLRKKSRQTKQG